MDPLLNTNGHDPGEELWSLKVVMARTGLSRSTIYSYVAEGIFPTQRRRAGHQPPEEWSFTVVLSEITKTRHWGSADSTSIIGHRRLRPASHSFANAASTPS